MFVLKIEEKYTLFKNFIEVRIITGCLEFNACGIRNGIKIKQN